MVDREHDAGDELRTRSSWALWTTTTTTTGRGVRVTVVVVRSQEGNGRAIESLGAITSQLAAL